MSGSSGSRRVAGYEVEHELAEGGMGTVYLAVQPLLERPAVLKSLRRDLAGDPVQEQRFRREAQTAARIHHPNVVAVYDCFHWRGELYLAQEYVDGFDLSHLLTRCGALPPSTAGWIALEVARGLEEIHAQGIVHRDLKPANVLISQRGEIKIADFGIALQDKGPALTQLGCAIGTAPYMSPEQLLGERVDDRSDSFSFGLLLYELLTQRRPFAQEDMDSEAALVRRIQRGRYPPTRQLAPGTPRWIARCISQCLRVRPARRPSLRELRRLFESRLPQTAPEACRPQLAQWLRQSDAFDASAEPDPGATRLKPAAAAPPRATPRRPRGRAWLRAAAGGVLIAAALAGVLWLGRGSLPDPPPWAALWERWTTETGDSPAPRE